jgi:hypothetical protein
MKTLSSIEIKPGHSVATLQCSKCKKVKTFSQIYPLVWRGGERVIYKKFEG